MTDFFQSKEGTEILDRMIQMTEGGQLTWSAEPDNDQFFWAQMPRFIVHVFSRDHDDAHPFVVRLLSLRTKAIVVEYETDPDSDPATISRVEDLYRGAKTQVYGLDTLFSDLSEDLDEVTRRRRYGPDEAPF